MEVKLVRYTERPLEAIAMAASNCYDTTLTEKNIPLIVKSCFKSGHHSVLEFAQFHFHIEGISRVCSHQLVRHRIASYAQRSQRYVEEDNFEYIMPDPFEDKYSLRKAYEQLMYDIKTLYILSKDSGIDSDEARFILPNACETIIDASFNLRSLINFLGHRLCRRASGEISELAMSIRNEVLQVAPELKDYLVPKCMYNAPYNFCTEDKCCGLSPTLKQVYTAKECMDTLKHMIETETGMLGDIKELVNRYAAAIGSTK